MEKRAQSNSAFAFKPPTPIEATARPQSLTRRIPSVQWGSGGLPARRRRGPRRANEPGCERHRHVAAEGQERSAASPPSTRSRSAPTVSKTSSLVEAAVVMADSRRNTAPCTAPVANMRMVSAARAFRGRAAGKSDRQQQACGADPVTWQPIWRHGQVPWLVSSRTDQQRNRCSSACRPWRDALPSHLLVMRP
jgi:hypothetical protein